MVEERERDDGSFGPLHQGTCRLPSIELTWLSTGLQAKPPRHTSSGNALKLAIAAAHGPLTSAPKLLLTVHLQRLLQRKSDAYKDRGWKHVPDCDITASKIPERDFHPPSMGCERAWGWVEWQPRAKGRPRQRAPSGTTRGAIWMDSAFGDDYR